MTTQTPSSAVTRSRPRSFRWLLGSLLTLAGATVTSGLVVNARADKDAAKEPAKEAGKDAGKEADKDTPTLKGKVAPDLTLNTVDGRVVKLSDHKGKVIVIDFWAIWCAPCVKSLPHIAEMAGRKAWQDKGLVVWAVNLKEKQEKVKTFLAARNFGLTVPLDPEGKAAEAYNVEGVPTALVIGRDGKVAEVLDGLGPDSDDKLEAAVKKALEQK